MRRAYGVQRGLTACGSLKPYRGGVEFWSATSAGEPRRFTGTRKARSRGSAPGASREHADPLFSKALDGTITTEAPVESGQPRTVVTIGLHAAKRGTRFEALEPRQGVREPRLVEGESPAGCVFGTTTETSADVQPNRRQMSIGVLTRCSRRSSSTHVS